MNKDPIFPRISRVLENPWIILVTFILIFVLAGVLRTLPYLLNDFYFNVGFDTGTYQSVLNDYLTYPLTQKPGFPPVGIPNGDMRIWADPGFFMIAAMTSTFSSMTVHEMFRWFLPLLVGILFVLMIFTLSRRFLGVAAGLLLALLVSVSYVQVDTVNEAYYKQLIGSFLLILSLLMFDRFQITRRRTFLYMFALFSAGILFYHRPTFFLLGVIILILLIYFGLAKNKESLKALATSILVIAVITSIIWIPNLDVYVSMLIGALETSLWRFTTLPTGEGLWEGGGSILELFRGFDHVILGYLISIIYLIPFVILGAAYAKRTSRCSIILLSTLVLLAYVSLWLVFGNRFIVSLDLMMLLIAVIGVVYLVVRTDLKRNFKVVVCLLLVILIVVYTANVIIYQSKKQPYIVENMEGIQWIETNIDSEVSLIFAPDYLSADIIQLGYRMAIWDSSLGAVGYETNLRAEEFMLYSPSNQSFNYQFFANNPQTMYMNIYVLWGTWDLDRPMIIIQENIPCSEYFESENYELVYSGYDEILSIFRYVGDRGTGEMPLDQDKENDADPWDTYLWDRTPPIERNSINNLSILLDSRMVI